jgi:Putative peptidoglycan binding domain
MPRRRRGAKAVAVEAEERGLLMRILLHSPKDMVAGLLAAAAISAIVANALFLQAGRHPSPMFGTTVPPAQPLPRPRPAEAAAIRSIELTPADVKAAEPKAEPKYESKSEPKPDAMSNLVVKTTAPPAPPAAAPPAAAPPAAVLRPPAPVPVPVATPHTAAGRKIAAVQRALTEYGYGQLKPTGLIGADTQAAITKFERDRKLPVTGQMSDRLVKELSAMTGRPID